MCGAPPALTCSPPSNPTLYQVMKEKLKKYKQTNQALESALTASNNKITALDDSVARLKKQLKVWGGSMQAPRHIAHSHQACAG